MYLLTRTTIPQSLGTSTTTIALLDNVIVSAQPSPTQPDANVPPHQPPRSYSCPPVEPHTHMAKTLSYEYTEPGHKFEKFEVFDHIREWMYHPSQEESASGAISKIFGSWEPRAIKNLVIAKLSSSETESYNIQCLDETSSVVSHMDRVQEHSDPPHQLFEKVDSWLADLAETPQTPAGYPDKYN